MTVLILSNGIDGSSLKPVFNVESAPGKAIETGDAGLRSDPQAVAALVGIDAIEQPVRQPAIRITIKPTLAVPVDETASVDNGPHATRQAGIAD